MARTDPALAGESAVLLLERISPAVNQIDSSSGALGNATNGVVEKMVPLIAAAPVPRLVREKWLDRLLDAAFLIPWAVESAQPLRFGAAHRL